MMRDIPESHRDLLSGKGLSFVTTVKPNGLLSVHPVSVLWDGGRLRFSTRKIRGKYRNLRQDDRISICIPDPTNVLRYLEIRGRATLEDDPQRTFINKIAKHFMGRDEYPYDPPDAERVTVTIAIEEVWAP